MSLKNRNVFISFTIPYDMLASELQEQLDLLQKNLGTTQCFFSALKLQQEIMELDMTKTLTQMKTDMDLIFTQMKQDMEKTRKNWDRLQIYLEKLLKKMETLQSLCTNQTTT